MKHDSRQNPISPIFCFGFYFLLAWVLSQTPWSGITGGVAVSANFYAIFPTASDINPPALGNANVCSPILTNSAFPRGSVSNGMLVPRAFRSVCFSPVRIGLGPLPPPPAAQVKGNGDVTLCAAAFSVFLLFLHINFCGAVPFAPSLKKSLLQRIKCNLEMLRLAFLSFPMIRGSSSASTLNRKHPSLAWAGKKIIVVSTAPGTKASPDQ